VTEIDRRRLTAVFWRVRMTLQARDRRDKSLRQQIIDLIDSRLENPDLDDTPQDILLWFTKIMNGEESFSIERIVFGGFLLEVMTTEEPGILREVRQELTVGKPYWGTYVVKYRFVELLQDEMLHAYETLQNLYELLIRKCRQSATEYIGAGELEKQELYREVLSDLVYGRLAPETIHELLLAQACNALIALPYHFPVKFNLADEESIFSTLQAPEHVVELVDYLEHTRDALMKLQGMEPLFIDVHLLPEGYSLSLR
jgi:hypothetical protein